MANEKADRRSKKLNKADTGVPSATKEPEFSSTNVVDHVTAAFQGSIAKSGPGRGTEGAPSTGPQVFGCEYCRARFDNFDEFRKHRRTEHGA